MISDQRELIIHAIKEPAFPESRFFMLREDLLPDAFGGNKVRIAKEYIADMKDEGKNAMLIYGDRRSNLCRVLAILCAGEGIPVRMLASPGDGSVSSSAAGQSSECSTDNASDPSIGFNERLIQFYGVEIVTSEKDIASSVDREMQRFRDEGYDPYYIFGTRFGTGNEGTAARAYAGVYHKIREWEAVHGEHFDRIALPYGTGCTYGGLLAGMLEADDRRKTVGISISSRTKERAEEILIDTVRGYFSKEGKEVPPGALLYWAMNLHTEYNCGGYGIVNEEVRETARRMLKVNGIGLPLIYGAKAYAGLLRYLSEHDDIRGKSILFIHTGGTPLFFDDLEVGLQ